MLFGVACMLQDRLRQGIAVALCGLALLAGLGSVHAARASARPLPHVSPTAAVLPVHVLKPAALALRLRALYPNARIEVASGSSLLVRATPQVASRHRRDRSGNGD